MLYYDVDLRCAGVEMANRGLHIEPLNRTYLARKSRNFGQVKTYITEGLEEAQALWARSFDVFKVF